MPASDYQAPTTTIQSRPVAPVAAIPVAAPAPATDGLADDKASRSPIAGVVQKVVAEVGQTVAVDDLLAVLEAMKMETKITSHVAGTVKKIYVAAGEAVKSGQIIIEFE
jgi:methylmalonyl-CoA carboxyltransferase small subunit